MSVHTGRVTSVNPDRGEVLLTMESAACRVCGGSGCALRGRSIRAAVALSPEDRLERGCLVGVVAGRRATTRAVIRLLLAPGSAALVAMLISGQPFLSLATAAGVIAFSVIGGSKRDDLPRVVAILAPATPNPTSASPALPVFPTESGRTPV